MNPIESLPDLEWNDIASREIAMTGEELLAHSDFMWRLGDVAICGLIYQTWTSPPWLWFALATNVTFGDLIDFRRLATLIPEGTLTAVQSDLAIAKRFAKFYGFTETGRQQGAYTIYRRA
jgi:hypothetical protein